MKRAGIMRVARPDQWTVQDWAHELEYAAANAISESLGQALRRAARSLFHQPSGRREKFRDAAADRAHIAEARNLVETGQAASEWAAFMKVAATIPGPSQRSIAERLRRKAGRENRPLNSISGRRAAAKLARDSEKG